MNINVLWGERAVLNIREAGAGRVFCRSKMLSYGGGWWSQGCIRNWRRNSSRFQGKKSGERFLPLQIVKYCWLLLESENVEIALPITLLELMVVLLRTRKCERKRIVN